MADIEKHAPDVQLRLRLVDLLVFVEGNFLYLSTSFDASVSDHLPDLLRQSAFRQIQKSLSLPYILGRTPTGSLMPADLADFPHLLIAGATNSGKSVGLKSLISTLAFCRQPTEVKLVIVDVGAGDLICFRNLPHLLFPIVQDTAMACQTIKFLVDEMERRIQAEHVNIKRNEPKIYPYIVAVFDEFTALVSSQLDKDEHRLMISNISQLLQRGRHARIHLVLAAQNPTIRNMEVDLGNITARIAFRVAKRNYSETILGVSGAERLSGYGDMLFKPPDSGMLERLQGVYISPSETTQLVSDICEEFNSNDGFPDAPLSEADEFKNFQIPSTCPSLADVFISPKPSHKDRLLAKVIEWSLHQDEISTNLIMGEFHLGWKRAKKIVDILEKLGVVGELSGKLPRDVMPQSPDDIPDELYKFLEECGISKEAVHNALEEKAHAKIKT